LSESISTSAVNAAKSAAEKAIGYQIDRFVSAAATKIVEVVFGGDREYDRKIMNDYHEKMLEIVDKAPLPRDVTSIPQYESLSPSERAKKEIERVQDLISQSKKSLEEAKNISRCGVCKAELEDTLRVVDQKTEDIVISNAKVLAMQKLKERGELPPSAKWDDLSKSQKALVDAEVSASGIQITKHKQGSPRKKQTKKKPNKSNRSKAKLLQKNLVVKNEEED